MSAFQIAMKAHDPHLAPIIYWYLGSPSVQRAITENASGSTGLGNIAIGWLKKLLVPDLTRQDRDRYVTRCETLNSVVDRRGSLGGAAADLRRRLLAALLSGEHEIPESYDDLIGV